MGRYVPTPEERAAIDQLIVETYLGPWAMRNREVVE